jgi:ABC-2 type transport system ATP-binding protein
LGDIRPKQIIKLPLTNIGTLSDPIITTDQLAKYFRVPTRQAGLRASMRGLFHRSYTTVKAVSGISFSIQPGEVVGFLGPNGAGKTTTLKMLSGLLYPTGGELQVLGYQPSRRDKEFLGQITLVMGNRNQLNWDLPALDSFELQRAIYQIPQSDFLKTRDEFIELLELKDLVRKPVRNLSLGERMKMEIAGALLHRPKMLFLDEPTIGLDVTMQRRIREFIAEYNQRQGATVLLTSHYMADVEALCRRVIIIHHGQILFDGDLSQLIERFSAFKTIQVTLADSLVGAAPLNTADFQSYGEVLNIYGSQATLRVPKAQTAQITARILSELNIDDLTVEDPPIEDIIAQVFSHQSTDGEKL